MTGFQLQGNAAERYEEFTVVIMAPFVDAIVAAADLGDDAALLDVACGTGFVARAVGRSHPDAVVTGVDVNDTMLAVATQRAGAEGLTTVWRKAPADQLPFDDDAFDAATCQQGLQFFPDPDAAVAEMARVVHPGGTLAVTVWSPLERSPYFAAQRQAVHTVLGDEEAADFDAAFAFSDQRLHAVFSDAGLRDVTVTEVVADITIDGLRDFVRGHFGALPWGAAAAQAGPDGIAALGDAVVQELQPHLDGGDSVTLAFSSWLATGRT